MATYYVRSSGGSDSNDGLSFANGWATLPYAEANTIGGDEILVCADGDHTITTYINMSNGTTTRTSPVKWIGANALGVVDGTMATISGVSLAGAYQIMYFGAVSYWLFKYLRFTAGKDKNLYINSGFSNGMLIFIHCRIDNAIGDGVYDRDTSVTKLIQYIDTEIDNNSNCGVSGSTTATGSSVYINCSIHDNGSHGLDLNNYYSETRIIGSLIYRNGGSGIYSSANAIGFVILNNIFFSNTGHGIYLNHSSAANNVILNNVFRSNGGYGINTVVSSLDQFSFCDYNCSHNNTSGDININSGVLPGSNNVLQDPLFTSETIGSEVFTVQSGSPCINVGYGYNGV